MTRKTKILFVAAFIAFVAVGIVLFANSKQPEGRITYGGVSANDSNQVLFVLTNPFPDRLSISIYAMWRPNEMRSPLINSRPGTFFSIPAFSETNFSTGIQSTNTWRVAGAATRMYGPSALNGLRKKLAKMAYDRGWNKTFNWLAPVKTLPEVSGPLMLGNKPAPPEQK
jgi:hypothetical protein